jgi:hypothetical protein
VTAGARLNLRDLFVPVGSVALLLAMLALVLGTAGSTLGYDYRCYEGAAQAFRDGRPMYDVAYSVDVGKCPGTYTYPPIFALALVPWLSLGGAAAGLWCLAMAACFLAGVALLPVRNDVRWLIVIVAALDWPVLYAVKLGQVEPILFLLFAATWRRLDRPWAVGVATAVGALVKVQPAAVAVWAAATGRRPAVAVAAAVTAAGVAVSVLIAGTGPWASYVELLRSLGGKLTTPHNYAPGAVAYQAGLPLDAASAVQLASVALAAAVLLAALRYAPHDLSLQITIVVSQLLSSPLRDHYAVLLLLPTAWLVQRGKAWAVAFPLAGWLSLFAFKGDEMNSWPAAASVPLIFFGLLAVLAWEVVRGRTARQGARKAPEPA